MHSIKNPNYLTPTMNKNLVIGLLMLILVASCAPREMAKSTTQTAATTQTTDTISRSADNAPAETLDNELDTKSLDTVDSELGDLTW